MGSAFGFLKNGKLYIKKLQITEWLVLYLFSFNLFFAFLTEVVSLPSFIKFSLDAVLLISGILIIYSGRLSISKKILPIMFFVVGFAVYVIAAYSVNYQSPFYFLWGFRNLFRFYLAFIVFYSFLNEELATFCLKLMDVAFWVHIFLVIIQFAFLDIHQDQIGGIFGTALNTNGYTIIFLCVILIKTLVSAFNKTENIWYCIAKCAAVLLNAAMAEIKFLFIAFVIILIVTSLVTAFSWRKVAIIVSSFVIIIVALNLLSIWFSEFADFFRIENIIAFATQENYSTSGDVNRLSAIPKLAKTVVKSPIEQIFGLGLGNCDTSSISVFQSSFYREYSLLHYEWFSSAFLFLEVGYIGLGMYLLFFILTFLSSLRMLKRGANRLFCQTAMTLSIICGVLVFYNASLKTEAAYFAYFILALPFLEHQEKGSV